jgi:hypothetical protein
MYHLPANKIELWKFTSECGNRTFICSKRFVWRLVAGFSTLEPGLEIRPGHVGFVVHKAALGLVFSEYFGFP